jgi:ATP adenylyltransferase
LTVSGKTEYEDEAKKFGPGSDINLSHPNQVIGIINSTHILALNIYPVFRPQYLLLTLDSYRKQNELLDLHDLAASLEFLNMDGGEGYYVMYNCAEESGCSRNHKHVQIVPKPEFAFLQGGFHFFPDIKEYETAVNVPYVYFLQYFSRTTSTIEIWGVYRGLLRKCRRSLGMNENDEEMVCPHNVVLTAVWMLLIPRRTGTYKGVMVNAAGMMGMPTMASDELFAIWKKVGPSKALSEFGVPRKGAE